MKNVKKAYLEVLRDGSAIECNRLSLCLLNNYYPKLRGDTYQVDCDDYRMKFSKLYRSNEINKAVDKYIELKKKLYR